MKTEVKLKKRTRNLSGPHPQIHTEKYMLAPHFI